MNSRMTQVVIAIALVASAAVAIAKPERAPIRVEAEVPPNVKTGDEVTTTIALRALADIDRLEVKLAPFTGLELLSEPREAVFAGIKKNETRTLTVTIRLTAQTYGSLAVLYTTFQGQQRENGATTIVFGTGGK